MKAPLSVLVGILAIAHSAFAFDPSTYRLQLGSPNIYRLQTEPAASSFQHGRFYNGSSSAVAAMPYASEIASAAQEAGIDPALVHALIHVESAYRADAVSGKRCPWTDAGHARNSTTLRCSRCDEPERKSEGGYTLSPRTARSIRTAYRARLGRLQCWRGSCDALRRKYPTLP